MRILCLHGMGGNARMFEAQTNPITWSLRQDGHEFVYVDGISPCEPLDERIGTMYPPPYLAYCTSAFKEDWEDAVSYIEEIIHEEGPFDGVVAFSQGCALAAALMFQRQRLDPDDVAFRFAVFMGAPMPLNLIDSHSRAPQYARLQIPVLHVLGKKDHFALEALKLATMHSDRTESTLLEHEEGHHVPKDLSIIAAISRWLAKQAVMSFVAG